MLTDTRFLLLLGAWLPLVVGGPSSQRLQSLQPAWLRQEPKVQKANTCLVSFEGCYVESSETFTDTEFEFHHLILLGVGISGS